MNGQGSQLRISRIRVPLGTRSWKRRTQPRGHLFTTAPVPDPTAHGRMEHGEPFASDGLCMRISVIAANGKCKSLLAGQHVCIYRLTPSSGSHVPEPVSVLRGSSSDLRKVIVLYFGRSVAVAHWVARRLISFHQPRFVARLWVQLLGAVRSGPMLYQRGLYTARRQFCQFDLHKPAV